MTPIVVGKTVIFLGKAEDQLNDTVSWWVSDPDNDGSWFKLADPPENG